jgi:hypothetical protein
LLATGLLAAAALVAPAQAQAQVNRNFPANALRGTLVVGLPPEVMLNGAPARLAPAARIRAQNNMVVMSGALSGQPLLVHYTLDVNGDIFLAWILTEAEAAKSPWPTKVEQLSTWSFDPLAQTWTKQ